MHNELHVDIDGAITFPPLTRPILERKLYQETFPEKVGVTAAEEMDRLITSTVKENVGGAGPSLRQALRKAWKV